MSHKQKKRVFLDMAQTGKTAATIIDEKDLKQIGSAEELEEIILDVIKNNPDQVAKYKTGKDKLFGFFVGQSMKATKGKGNPKVIQELLKKHLG